MQRPANSVQKLVFHRASWLVLFCQGQARPASLSAAWSPAALALRRRRRPSERRPRVEIVFSPDQSAALSRLA